MHRYSPAARRLVHAVRWNSTAENASKTSSVNVSPKNTESTASENPTSFLAKLTGQPRLPPKPEDSSPFIPNVDEAMMPPGNLAVRLAQQVAQSAPPNNLESSDAQPPTAQITETPERSKEEVDALVARRRELLLARRAEREARQAAESKQYPQPRRPGSFTTGVPSETERPQPLVLGGPAAREGRTQNNSRGTRGRGGRGGGGRGRNNRGLAAREEDYDEFPPEIDEWLETDGISLASELDPEFSAPGPLKKELESGDTTQNSKPNRRVVREILGGDYSYFVPGNPHEFVSAARKLGAAKHSSVVLTYNRDLPVEHRFHLSKLVGTSSQPSKNRTKA